MPPLLNIGNCQRPDDITEAEWSYAWRKMLTSGQRLDDILTEIRSFHSVKDDRKHPATEASKPDGALVLSERWRVERRNTVRSGYSVQTKSESAKAKRSPDT